jgi:hypothetical protein
MAFLVNRITAKYDGKCRKCAGAVAIGDDVMWVRSGDKDGRRSTYHPHCWNDDERERRTQDKTQVKTEVPPPQTDPVTERTSGGLLDLEALADEMLPRLEKRGIKAGQETKVETHHIVLVKREDGTEKRIENAHPMLPRLMRMIQHREHVFIKGPPGSGKSHGVRQAFEACGMPFRYISLAPTSMPTLIMGYTDLMRELQRTGFRESCEYGGGFMFDEVCNSNQSLLASLNTALSNGHCEFPDKSVAVHPDFVCVCADNTNGRGGDLLFPNRRELDMAFHDRFAYLDWDYDMDFEMRLAREYGKAHVEAAEAWCNWIHKVRGFCRREGMEKLLCSPRAIYRGVKLLATETVADLADMLVFKGIEDGMRDKVLAAHPLPSIRLAS